MRIPNDLTFNPHPIYGATQPEVFWGTEAPAATSLFKNKNIGSVYWRKVANGQIEQYVKGKNDGVANDYSCVKGVISLTVARAAFTDGGAALGTFVVTQDLPAGAIVEDVSVLDVTGFTGDTSATLTVGDGTDVDRYSTGTPSVFATVGAVTMGLVSGVRTHATAMTTVTLTITSAADFTLVTAGQLTLRINYHF